MIGWEFNSLFNYNICLTKVDFEEKILSRLCQLKLWDEEDRGHTPQWAICCLWSSLLFHSPEECAAVDFESECEYILSYLKLMTFMYNQYLWL